MASIFGTEHPDVEVNFKAHPGQLEIEKAIRNNFSSEDAAAIIEIICGRGWGKTSWFVCNVLIPFLESHPNAKVMWVAPTYQIAMTPIDDVFKGVNESDGKNYVPEFDNDRRRVWEFVTTKAGPLLRWHNGASVVFRSADSPDSIVSKGFNLILIDEACLIADEKVFTQQILGTARKEGVKIFMISTPRGKKHWTYKYFLKGQDPKEKMYLSFQQAYTKNPFYSKVLIELIKDLPEWLVRQEYMAEFIDDGESVFKGILSVLKGVEISWPTQQQEWALDILDIDINRFDGPTKLRAKDRRFVVGCDLAKSVDYTVLWGMCLDSGQCVYYKRFNKTDYREVLKIATKVCHDLSHAELIFDATGVGQGLADMFNDYDVNAHPFVFTNESKNEIVNKLAMSIEHGEIEIPNIKTVVNELSVFTYTITRTGKISYGAPSGFHDDIVMAMAMANFYRKENAGSGEIGVIDEVLAANDIGNKPGSFMDYMANDND